MKEEYLNRKENWELPDNSGKEYIEVEKELIETIYSMIHGEVIRLQDEKLPLYYTTQVVVVWNKLRKILGYEEPEEVKWVKDRKKQRRKNENGTKG